MVNHHEGGGRAGTVAEQVDALSTEIEDLYGQLRGVEESWEQLIAPLATWEGQDADNPAMPNPTIVGRTFHIRGSYPFEVGYQFPGSDHPDYNETVAQQIQSSMDAAYDACRGSGTGILDFSRYILTQVIEPDHAAIAAAARDLDEVAMWLFTYTNDGVPDFVTSLVADWPVTSQGSKSFFDFYEDLADVCTQYYIGAAQLAGATASLSTVVRLYQDNLIGVLRSARDQLVKALETWQSFKGPEQLETIRRSGDGPSDASLLGATSLLAGIAGLLPPLGLAMGVTSVVTGLLAYSADGGDIETRIDRVEKAFEINAALNEALLDLRREMGDALDGIGKRGEGEPGFGRFVRHTLRNDNWVAREVDLG